jgi:hypothetical protein
VSTPSRRLQVVAALISFFLYAIAAVAVPQYGANFFYCERVGLAAGTSSVLYGAPFGKVYPAVQAQLLDMRSPAEATLNKVTRLEGPLGDQTTAINDGNGLGFIVSTNWAMRLFGPHLTALPLFTLALMATSVAIFLWRFRDEQCALVTVTFFSLTLMMCTPLLWDLDIASQIPIGGIRYFSLVAIVPAFHLVLEIADTKEHDLSSRTRTLQALLAAMQTVLLVLAVLVRGSAASAAAPILLVGLVIAWRNRGNRYELRLLRQKATVIGVVGLVFVGSLLVSLPSRYVRDGRLTTIVWHRAIISLGLNPAWPFGNLREVYDCKIGGIPEGLVGGTADRNGHCIWWHYLVAHSIPTEGAITATYSSRYESAMRTEFFNIAGVYPYDVFITFFFYKPEWLIRAIKYLVLNPMLHSHILLVLVLAGFANFLGFLAIPASRSTRRMTLRLMTLGVLFGITSIPTYLVAWATPHTVADLLFYCLFCIGMGLDAVAQLIRPAMKH